MTKEHFRGICLPLSVSIWFIFCLCFVRGFAVDILDSVWLLFCFGKYAKFQGQFTEKF